MVGNEGEKMGKVCNLRWFLAGTKFGGAILAVVVEDFCNGQNLDNFSQVRICIVNVLEHLHCFFMRKPSFLRIVLIWVIYPR